MKRETDPSDSSDAGRPNEEDASSDRSPTPERKQRPGKRDHHDKNPLSRLHFGGAGSGGAEDDPGPDELP